MISRRGHQFCSFQIRSWKLVSKMDGIFQIIVFFNRMAVPLTFMLLGSLEKSYISKQGNDNAIPVEITSTIGHVAAGHFDGVITVTTCIYLMAKGCIRTGLFTGSSASRGARSLGKTIYFLVQKYYQDSITHVRLGKILLLIARSSHIKGAKEEANDIRYQIGYDAVMTVTFLIGIVGCTTNREKRQQPSKQGHDAILGRPGVCCCQSNVVPKVPLPSAFSSKNLHINRHSYILLPLPIYISGARVCGKQRERMSGDWGPVVVAVVLFVVCSPGLLCQLPGNKRAVEFANFQTSPISIFVHTIIFFGLVTIFVIAIGIHIYSG
ncbi:Protein of unknown function DUF3339 - like 7 [Theobroma cacao]|nr:Protein of unknown function DUF3339 - like 5 [Theobroma cacao]WRX21648.1 Protein of unknown function DUF3339 - like 7 [Theobroma cacao]